jgi:hypothetical protein
VGRVWTDYWRRSEDGNGEDEMILKRYGSNVLSVTPNFDSRAMTEVGFMRDGALSLPVGEFADQYERVGGRELTASAEGDVQGDVEDAVLADLLKQVESVAAEAGEGSVLLIENEVGKDQAKTRGTQATKVVATENRLFFTYTIDPPLRIGIHRKKG